MSRKDFDLGLRASWKYLRAARHEQVENRITRALEADHRLVTGTILQRLFDPTPRVNDWGHTVYGLWSGDSMVPPNHMGRGLQYSRRTPTQSLVSGGIHTAAQQHRAGPREAAGLLRSRVECVLHVNRQRFPR